MARADVDEVNVEPVDRRHELRIGIELGLRLSPVVVRSPVAHEFLKLREPHALRSITDSLAVGPPRREDAAPEVNEHLLGNLDAERTDCAVLGGCTRHCWKEAGGTHGRRARKKAAPAAR